MTVEQSSVVDIAYIDSGTGLMHLVIADHREWNDDHLFALQEKINVYLSFIESGELFERFPDATAKDIRIDVIAKYRPNADALHFLGHARAILEQAGVGLACLPGPDGYVDGGLLQ